MYATHLSEIYFGKWWWCLLKSASTCSNFTESCYTNQLHCTVNPYIKSKHLCHIDWASLITTTLRNIEWEVIVCINVRDIIDKRDFIYSIFRRLKSPDGLIFSLFGPEVGRKKDITLYRASEWGDVLQELRNIDEIQYYIFGDSEYILRPWIQRPVYRDMANCDRLRIYTEMRTVLVSVEHNYNDLKQYWTSQDLYRNLKVWKAPVALLYMSYAIPLNFCTWFYKCEKIREQFDVTPPWINEYLAA